MEVLDELKQLGDELKSAWEEYKTHAEQRVEEVKKLGEASPRRRRRSTRSTRASTSSTCACRSCASTARRSELDRDKPEVKAFEKLFRQGPARSTEDEVKHIKLASDNRDGTEKKTMTSATTRPAASSRRSRSSTS
jgi:hypothetical protein